MVKYVIYIQFAHVQHHCSIFSLVMLVWNRLQLLVAGTLKEFIVKLFHNPCFHKSFWSVYRTIWSSSSNCAEKNGCCPEDPHTNVALTKAKANVDIYDYYSTFPKDIWHANPVLGHEWQKLQPGSNAPSVAPCGTMVLISHRCTCQCKKNAMESQQNSAQEIYAQYLNGSDCTLSRSYRGCKYSCPLVQTPSSQCSPSKKRVVISENNLHWRIKLRVGTDASLTALRSLPQQQSLRQWQLHHLLLQPSRIFPRLGNSVFVESEKNVKN